MSDTRADRFCVSCGRRIQWRAKWSRDWESVRYCSDACRRRGIRTVDLRLEEVIRERLPRRGAMISDVDAADAVAAETDLTASELREPARRAARRLVVAGEVELVQAGRVVDASTARGPFHIRRTS